LIQLIYWQKLMVRAIKIRGSVNMSTLKVKHYFQVVTLTPDSCFGLIFGDFLVEVGAGTAFVTTGVSVCIGSAAALGTVQRRARHEKSPQVDRRGVELALSISKTSVHLPTQ
jgi:hypothetical protein